jgi:hypothetical protein
LKKEQTVQHDEKRDEALEVYWGIDLTDTGDLVDETVLEIEECEDPLK